MCSVRTISFIQVHYPFVPSVPMIYFPGTWYEFLPHLSFPLPLQLARRSAYRKSTYLS